MQGSTNGLNYLKILENLGMKPFPRMLLLQMINCVKDNKNHHLFAFFSLLIAQRVFDEVQLGFLVVQHTHKDIDGSFGYLSKKLKENIINKFDASVHDIPRLAFHFPTHSRDFQFQILGSKIFQRWF
jgi:hypothetical protein